MFVPFGEVVDVQLPLDFETRKYSLIYAAMSSLLFLTQESHLYVCIYVCSLESHRGFAFVEFELAEDAAAAVDNMVRWDSRVCVGLSICRF